MVKASKNESTSTKNVNVFEITYWGTPGGSIGYASAFGSGCDLRVLGSGPRWVPCSAGSLVGILSLPCPLPPLQINKLIKNKNKNKKQIAKWLKN